MRTATIITVVVLLFFGSIALYMGMVAPETHAGHVEWTEVVEYDGGTGLLAYELVGKQITKVITTRLTLVDVTNAQLLARVHPGHSPRFIGEAAGLVWLEENGQVLGRDPTTLQVVGPISSALKAPPEVKAPFENVQWSDERASLRITAADRYVWLVSRSGEVTKAPDGPADPVDPPASKPPWRSTSGEGERRRLVNRDGKASEKSWARIMLLRTGPGDDALVWIGEGAPSIARLAPDFSTVWSRPLAAKIVGTLIRADRCAVVTSAPGYDGPDQLTVLDVNDGHFVASYTY